MTSLLAQLNLRFAEAFEVLGLPVQASRVTISDRPELAHFQCNGALKAQAGDPLEVAERIVKQLAESIKWAKLTAAGSGFINIRVSDDFLAEMLNLMAADERFGCLKTTNPRQICIDFGGPNVAKPLHVGHLRSGIIGDSLQRLNRFAGHLVTGDVHLGDWGTQMGMVICAIRREQPDLPYFDSAFTGPYPETSPVSLGDLERLYPTESNRCKTEPEAMAAALQATRDLQAGNPGYLALWRHFTALSVASARQLYDRLGISFDLWDGESTVNGQIPELLERLRLNGTAVMSQGALIIALASPPPLLLQKSDGAYLYATTDLATLESRLERGEQTIYYVVDKRQSLHFRQLFEVADLIGWTKPGIVLEFHGYGTMNGPDNKPFKTRSGGVMRLDELIRSVEERAAKRLDELGIAKEYPDEEKESIVRHVATAALKFADLINNKTSDYAFDIERFTSFEGKTGPYLLYTAVRAKSVLRTVDLSDDGPMTISDTGEFERSLLLIMAALPEAVADAISQSAPHVICDYAFRLSQEYNRFYQSCNILHESDPARQRSWLAITLLLVRQLELLSALVGIQIPERM